MNDLLATVDLQKVVWRMGEHECSSPHTMKAATVAGGCVLGAKAEGRLIGFCFGFAAKRGAEIWLWSHMTAVHPDYQGRGIGFQLKQAQREWSLSQGYRVMAWTFDPMQAGNANFNFNLLGVAARRYYVNHYGDMLDGINAGLASDRLEARWELAAPNVLELARSHCRGHARELPDSIEMALREKRGELQYRNPQPQGDTAIGIEVPLNIAELKRRDLERGIQWQAYVREAMTTLLAADYVVSGFQRQGQKAWYLLSRAN